MLSKMDDLVGWLRSTSVERVPAETIDLLDSGISKNDLWSAGALTASLYVSNQARNLLGFVSHAMIGCEDARQAAEGQQENVQRLLLIQALSQVVVDLEDPCFSPYELLSVPGITEADTTESERQLRSDVRFGEWLRADHRFVGLAEILPREEFIDLALDIGLEGMITDDHTFITTALSLDMMELTGWDRGLAMLRATLRYSCTFPRDLQPYAEASDLVTRHDLHRCMHSGPVDVDLSQSLRQSLFASEPGDRPGIVVSALLSENPTVETLMSALSLAACDMYLRVDPVPHDAFDAVSREVAPIHLGTTLNVIRTNLHRMSLQTQARAVLMGAFLLRRGPSVLNENFEFIPFSASQIYPSEIDISELSGESDADLIAILEDSLFQHDGRTATAAVAQLGRNRVNPEDVISLLTRVACTDDGTLMHNVKHLHACIEEFRWSSHPDKWNYLVAASKWISWYAGKSTETYERTMAVMSV